MCVCVTPGVLQELAEGTLAAQTALCFLSLLGCAVGWFRDACFTLLSDKELGSECVGAFLERHLCSSGFEAEMDEAVAGFALREGVLPSARVLGSASSRNEVTSLSAG